MKNTFSAVTFSEKQKLGHSGIVLYATFESLKQQFGIPTIFNDGKGYYAWNIQLDINDEAERVFIGVFDSNEDDPAITNDVVKWNILGQNIRNYKKDLVDMFKGCGFQNISLNGKFDKKQIRKENLKSKEISKQLSNLKEEI